MTAVDKMALKEVVRELILEDPTILKDVVREILQEENESPEARRKRVNAFIQADFDEFDETFKALA